ncbi:MAG TPA: thioredoxin [bacterium]|jgi:thioredoxin 1|nr:thioredoxin [bacterium]HOP55970.1 thioredoxin [bacterium]HRR91004.1 thioredoxin [bacterium]
MNLKNSYNRVKAVSSADFDSEVINSSMPVLVDFWADWCMPCKMLSPIVEEVAEELADRLKVVKVNVDENPDLAMSYGVQAIPTLLVFKDGRVVIETVGYLSKKALMDKLGEVIK